ncbi:uncharacterized protein N7483_003470 [Penicillium malachiteum]|uniref:uncharacterized protein n=1 Tax=Penicillium malachiteum TaxID=1324776 RepID=UPI002547E684|nr:uncharacterized protein N7483_003470 [Penicillium malachiteum]KAJ5728962.1 hypothetical protein N7483_003470 [Penicillium malachiteum]
MRESPSSFAALMALQRLDDTEVNKSSSDPERIEQFQSLAAPYPPGLGNRAFGGHVYAQSAYAASKTVEKGFVIHAITGSFIVGGRLDIPYIYTIRHVRDGYMYSTRAVDARQDGKICFSCLCSFKRDEGFQDYQHQPPAVQDRYRDILSAKRPEEQDISHSVDVDWWIEAADKGDITEKKFPGLDVRKVDMQNFNKSEEIKSNPEKYRQLMHYCLKGSPDEQADATLEEIRERELAGEYDNLYACAHMYASDKNSLLLIPRALGFTRWAEMGSLSLTVIVHRHGNPLRMIDWDAVSKNGDSSLQMKWFIQEGWSPQSAENRVVHESHLWNHDGKLIATSMQDGMLRVQKLSSRGKL